MSTKVMENGQNGGDSFLLNEEDFEEINKENLVFDEIEIPVPWGHIAGKWWGSRNVQPIIALHGWQDNCGTFDGLAPILKQHGNSILCIDLPGHGLSSHLPPGHKYYLWWDGVHYLRRIVRYFKWKKITIIGHSMGGGIAFLYATVYPDDVEKYINIDIAGPAVRESKQYCEMVGMAIDKFLNYEKLNLEEEPCFLYNEMIDVLHNAHKGSLTFDSCKILAKRGSRPSTRKANHYCFTRDPRIKVSVLGWFSLDQVLEMATQTKCEVMNIRAIPGYVSEHPENYDLILDAVEKNAKKMVRISISGTHHLHLNDGNSVAGHIQDFLTS